MCVNFNKISAVFKAEQPPVVTIATGDVTSKLIAVFLFFGDTNYTYEVW